MTPKKKEAPRKAKRETAKDWWECVCGSKQAPYLTDKSCKCKDKIYEPQWYKMPREKKALVAERKNLIENYPNSDSVVSRRYLKEKKRG